jgi:3-oxoacyl-[acyl-carrier-protein] synthase III
MLRNTTPPLRGRPSINDGRRRLLGVGAAFPGAPVSTDALCQQLEQKLGVKLPRYLPLLSARLDVQQRYLCRDFFKAEESPRPGARNPELAARALLNALNNAQLPAHKLGYLISHTATPATLLPAGSAEIARLIDYDGVHVELRQACTGFANALQLAFALTAAPNSAPVAIVGVETGSVFFDPRCASNDVSQWVNFLQMGDGAAGVIIAADDDEDLTHPRICSAYFGQMSKPPSSGLTLRAGGSDCASGQGILRFDHDFKSVETHGAALLEIGRNLLSDAGYQLDQASLIVPHQASGAIAGWLAKRWNLPVKWSVPMPDRLAISAAPAYGPHLSTCCEIRQDQQSSMLRYCSLVRKRRSILMEDSPLNSKQTGAVVDLRGVTLHHGKQRVLHDLSLRLATGSVAALYGPNGAGKSSLLRLIAGLNGTAKVSGHGQVLGQPFWSRPASARSDIAYMPQHGGLYEELTVLENLRFRSAMLGKTGSLTHAHDCIRTQQLQEVQEQIITTLSGGWKQRVAFAVALLSSPRLLLLDEPTAGVDLDAKAQIWQQIQALSARGVSVVVSTHDPDEARAAHELICLQSGRIANQGAPDQLSARLNLQILRITPKDIASVSPAELEDHVSKHLSGTPLAPQFYERDAQGLTVAFTTELDADALTALIAQLHTELSRLLAMERCEVIQPRLEQSLRAALIAQDLLQDLVQEGRL